MPDADLRLGLLVSIQDPADSRFDHHQLYAATIEQAREAEELGYHWVNAAEHHATTDGYLPAPLTLLAAIAAVTEEIRLSTGMLVLTLHHPLVIAEQAAVLDVISGGRLTLGIASGYRELEFDALGIEFEGRGRRFRESLEIMVEAWKGEPFSYAGKVFQIPEITVAPRPMQRPHPPLWLGGFGDAALTRAARWGSPCFPGGTTEIHNVEKLYSHYRELAAAKGLADSGLFLQRFSVVAETTEEARRLAYPGLRYTLEQYKAWGRPVEVEEIMGDWDRLDDTVIVGDEARCAEQIARYRELGVSDMMLQFQLPLTDPEVARESMRRFRAAAGSVD
jgi:probable F420-dependent oxidoreductase